MNLFPISICEEKSNLRNKWEREKKKGKWEERAKNPIKTFHKPFANVQRHKCVYKKTKKQKSVSKRDADRKWFWSDKKKKYCWIN